MSEHAGFKVVKVGTPVEIVASTSLAPTPYIGRQGKIVKLTEPRMMALVRLDDDLDELPRTFWIDELRALPAYEEKVCI